METLLIDWLSLILRWLHVIAGIAWVGASFYFVWLDSSLQEPPQEKRDRGLSGELWAVHGGGIYEVGKYGLAPASLPQTLHWFKWEAYATWISGALLLAVVYYWQAQLYLLSADKWLTSVPAAIAGSLMFLACGLLFYELCLRLLARRHPQVFLVLLVAFIGLACVVSVRLFSDRAAYLHLGAMLATVMAANVFWGIIPAQRRFLDALQRGETPDGGPMACAKLRSVHNNYLTLPVLFTMISNHYGFLYGHPYNDLLLIVILATAAYARHFFNLRNRGLLRPHILLVCAGVIAALMAAMAWQQVSTQKTQQQQHGTEQRHNRIQAVMPLVQAHCVNCHAHQPTLAGFSAAPAGLIIETAAQVEANAARIAAAVSSGYMPLGNLTNMTDEQRQALLQALAQ